MKPSKIKKDVKFEELYDVDDWEIETPNGWKNIDKIGKTIPYEIWNLKTENGEQISAADEHILYNENDKEQFLKDFKTNDIVQLKNKISKIKSIQNTNILDNMYDIQVDGHEYYANNFKNHNTTFLVNVCKQYIKAGLNVLYITLEVNENAIAERFDINMMNIERKDIVLKFPTKKKFKMKVEEIKNKYNGRLRIKEYPTASANVMHIRNLLDELKIKDNFEPDVLVLDYLNIASSIRYTNMGDTYNYVKCITEEFRGLCTEKNLIGWTATQFRRGNDNVSDANLEDVSESAGVGFTSDLMLAILETEEMRDENKLLFKIIKSRYDKLSSTSKFIMNVVKEKQQLTEMSSGDPNEYNKKQQDPDAKAEKAFYSKKM